MINCEHKGDIKVERWVEDSGVLMVRQTCLACGKVLDEGHVYGEDDGTWTGTQIIKGDEHGT